MIRSTLRLPAILFAMAIFITSAMAQGQVVYNSIPSPLPGNLASQPFQAQQTAEVGDRLQFAFAGGTLFSVTQTMSSWGCESGNWTTVCVTTPGSTFSHPITLNIYAVGAGNEPGALLGSVTQTFAIPFRPSSDAINCGDSRWYDTASASCFNGLSTNITFDTASLNLVLPSQVIYGIAFNTSNYGYAPMGPQACTGTPEGCGYDSLNVALTGTPSVGIDPAPDDAYWNSLLATWYCDGGANGFGEFRLDAGCWTGYKSVVRFNMLNTPTNTNQCKKNGWASLTRSDGTLFKNQGDCIQYVNTGN